MQKSQIIYVLCELTCAGDSISCESNHTGTIVTTWSITACSMLVTVSVLRGTFINICDKNTNSKTNQCLILKPV